MLYKSHFNLETAPFNLTPDTRFFFAEGNRKAIFAALLYSIGNGDGIVQVVGEVGSGKTMLSRLISESLGDEFHILFLLNPKIPPERILFAIALELGIGTERSEDKVSLLHKLHNALLVLHRQGKQTVLLVDEAQSIPLESLEEIRMLSNLETGTAKLLQVVLFGQPELDNNLNRHEVRQIKERIVHRFYLPRLTPLEVGRYLAFRLKKAGYTGKSPFTQISVRLITFKSRGFLRRINILADKCLLAAFSEGVHSVDAWVTLSVFLDTPKHKMTSWFSAIICIMFMALLVLFITGFVKYQEKVVKSPVATVPITEPESTPHTADVKSESPSRYSSPENVFIQLLQLKLNASQTLTDVIEKIIPADWLDRAAYVRIGQSDYLLFLGPFENNSQASEAEQSLLKNFKNNKPLILKQARINDLYGREPMPLRLGN